MDINMNQSPHFSYGEPTSGVFPVSAFSAFHLLRNYNYLMGPQNADIPKHLQGPRLPSDTALHSPKSDKIAELSVNIGKPFLGLSQHPIISHNMLDFHQHLPLSQHCPSSPRPLLSPDSYMHLKRHRGEKKPIPDEQKDEKYFERRRRNNQAAKKSRDARKIREDQIALRATILEHENAILKAQLLTLREEAASLRQLLLQKKTLESAT